MDRLSEIRERCDAATPGPWEPVNKSVRVAGTYKDSAPDGFSGGICNCIGNSYGVSKDHWVNVEARKNAAFIAHARDDIPYLLAGLSKATARAEKAEAENQSLKSAISQYCKNDCYRDFCNGNEDVGIPDCPFAICSPLPEPPKGE